VFWKIPHTTGRDDISLKLGRYRRTDTGEEVDVGTPKSELTLEDDEFRVLAEFLANHYEPLREGARRYLVLGDDLANVEVERVRALFGDPDREKVVNASQHSLSILTYDHVLERARRMLSIGRSKNAHVGAGPDIPF
jgi:hypothetical protein